MPKGVTERMQRQRLAGFLALSVALHLLLLATPIHVRTMPGSPRPIATITARLAQPDTQKSAVAVRHPDRSAARQPTDSSLAAPALPTAVDAPSPAAVAPTINLEAALVSARAYGREPPARKSLDAPRLPLTVASAVALATAPDVLTEARGAAGEYVTKIGNTRCVTPLVVPHFLEGKTMLTQCEVRKG